jgi:hypothetical protein
MHKSGVHFLAISNHLEKGQEIDGKQSKRKGDAQHEMGIPIRRIFSI